MQNVIFTGYKLFANSLLGGGVLVVPVEMLKALNEAVLPVFDTQSSQNDVNRLQTLWNNEETSYWLIFPQNITTSVLSNIIKSNLEDLMELRKWFIWGLRYEDAPSESIKIYASWLETDTTNMNESRIKIQRTLERYFLNWEGIEHIENNQTYLYNINVPRIYPLNTTIKHKKGITSVVTVPTITRNGAKYVVFRYQDNGVFLLKQPINIIQTQSGTIYEQIKLIPTTSQDTLNRIIYDKNMPSTVANNPLYNMIKEVNDNALRNSVRKLIRYFDYIGVVMNKHLYVSSPSLTRQVAINGVQFSVSSETTNEFENNLISSHRLEIVGNQNMEYNSILNDIVYEVNLTGKVLSENTASNVYGFVTTNSIPMVLLLALTSQNYGNSNTDMFEYVLDKMKYVDFTGSSLSIPDVTLADLAYYFPLPTSLKQYYITSAFHGDQRYYIALTPNNILLKLQVKTRF